MNEFLIGALRLMLALLFVGALGLQVLLPAMAKDLAGDQWEVVHLVTPYATVGILALLCVQIVLVVVWLLLVRVSRRSIFTTPSLRLVNLMVLCMALAFLLPAAVMCHLLFIVGVGGPGVVLALLGCLGVGLAAVLLTGVMKTLLGTAIAHSDELEVVI